MVYRASLLAFCSLWSVWAAPLTLQQALEETRQHHPLLTAADGRIDTAQGLLEQAKLRPNPRLTLQLENLRFGWQGPFSYGNEVDNFAFVTQTLETAKKRQRRTELAQANRRIAEAAKLVLQQELLGQVRQAWWRASGARTLLAVYDRTQTLLQSVVAFHEARVKEGAIAEVDLLRVQLEAEQLALQRQNALRDLELADIALQRAMGRAAFESLSIPPLEESLVFAESPLDEALARRAEMQLAQLQIAAERANQQLQVALARPNIDAMAGYKHTIGVETLMTGINMDLTVNNRNQGNIAAATASLRTAERELAALRASLSAEVKAALAEVKLRQRQLSTTLPKMRQMAAETARIADAAYREGGTDLLRLLDAQRLQLATELLHAQAWTEFRISLAGYETAVGAP